MRSYKTKIFCRAVLLASLMTGAGAPFAAASGNFPPMRAGWWYSSTVMHMNMTGQPPDTDNTPAIKYNCIDDATAAKDMQALAGDLPGCDTNITNSGGIYTLTIDCKNPSGTTGSITGVTTITTSGDTGMHFQGTTDANLSGMKMTSDMSGDYKWLGACPAGTVTGDFGTMENGVFKKQGNSLATN